MTKIVENQKRKAIRATKRQRFIEIKEQGLRQGIGTEAMGNVDNSKDGESTRRRRRSIIVLR